MIHINYIEWVLLWQFNALILYIFCMFTPIALSCIPSPLPYNLVHFLTLHSHVFAFLIDLVSSIRVANRGIDEEVFTGAREP